MRKINPNPNSMKKLLLSISAMAVVLASTAQCDQLFISEYVVGTGNNKAYELYNPTSNEIDLNGYQLQRWSNGDINPDNGGVTILSGTIPAYGTWVVANGQTEDIDLGGFISPACDPELQALADQLDNPYPAPTFMNGNDALVLVTNGTAIDIFGKPGEDPGQGWTAPDGTYITDSQTMVRKPSVTSGVTAPPITFMPLAQYDTLGVNNWTNLGIHACVCDPGFTSIEDRTPLDVSIYPTLIGTNEPLNIKTNYAIREVEVYDITGKIIRTTLNLSNANAGSVNLGNLSPGAYIVNIYMENNVTFSTRIIKN